jgi:hypothetical protein
MVHPIQAKRSFGLDGYAEGNLSETVSPSVSQGAFRDGYFVLEDVQVFDADDNVTEYYPKLEVMADVQRDSAGSILKHTPYAAALHCKEKGLFLPSMALSCVVLARLFALRGTPQFGRVLAQYKDTGLGWGYHGQNSVVDWKSRKVIHYPCAADFEQEGSINSGKRVSLGFDKSGLKTKTLESALEDANHRKFIQQLTGLQDLRILIEIGKHFEKPAHLWVPSKKTSTQAVWFGCGYVNFYLYTKYNLNGYYAFRGVRIPQ